MTSSNLSGPTLKAYRTQRGVSQQDLAEELGYKFASHVSRLERKPEVSRVIFAETVAAIERVAERKRTNVDPLHVLRTAKDGVA